jgi:hypothetical protein
MLWVSHVHFGNAYFLLQVFILLFHVMRCIGLPMQIKFFYHIFPPVLNAYIHSKGYMKGLAIKNLFVMQLSFDNGFNIKTPCLSIIDKHNQLCKSRISYFFHHL